MKKNFTRIYHISLLLLCLFLSLGAGEPLVRIKPEDSSQRPQAEVAGEGLFERMIIDKVTSMESSLRELTQKVESIERRLSKLEKTLEERPASPSFSLGAGSTATGPQEPPRKRLKDTVPKEKDIGDGLRVINVDYNGVEQNTFFKGEIENNSEDHIEIALFKIEVYGEQGNLLGIESFELKDIKRAWPTKFTLLIYKVDSDAIADYTIKRLR